MHCTNCLGDLNYALVPMNHEPRSFFVLNRMQMPRDGADPILCKADRTDHSPTSCSSSSSGRGSMPWQNHGTKLSAVRCPGFTCWSFRDAADTDAALSSLNINTVWAAKIITSRRTPAPNVIRIPRRRTQADARSFNHPCDPAILSSAYRHGRHTSGGRLIHFM